MQLLKELTPSSAYSLGFFYADQVSIGFSSSCIIDIVQNDIYRLCLPMMVAHSLFVADCCKRNLFTFSRPFVPALKLSLVL